MNKEKDLMEYVNKITFIIIILVCGFTFGVLYGGGSEACQLMIKTYGCSLDGLSDIEVNENIIKGGGNCSLVCTNEYTEDLYTIETINLTEVIDIGRQ